MANRVKKVWQSESSKDVADTVIQCAKKETTLEPIRKKGS